MPSPRSDSGEKDAGVLRAKHGPDGCSGASGTTFCTAADLCWACWWNHLLDALPRFRKRESRAALRRDRERLRWAAAEALERVEVEDCVTAELILSRVVRLDGTIVERPDA